MARESTRKREERRFGRPERLVDLFPPSMRFHDFGAVPIEATNVHDYYMEFMGKHKQINLMEDIPSCRMPYPRLFVEMACSNLAGYRVGWVFKDIDPVCNASVVAAQGGVDFDRCQKAAAGTLYTTMGDFLHKPASYCFLHMDQSGKLLTEPALKVDDDFHALGVMLARDPLWLAMETLVPVMLAVGFMNCRNVTIRPTEPPADINRQRRRAGLRPFVRYHTINIEPMKAVLRTEGDVEHNGLKRALHICRGHFATYTDTMFGRKLEKPVTVFREAHVRGSAKEGLVISDYKVNPPKGGPR